MISLLIGIGVSLLVAGYNYAINRSAMKKAAREKSETAFDQPNVPVVDEQSSIPVIFGTVKLTGPNVVWWKKEPMQSINQTISHNQFKKYRYNQLGLHLVFCHGPIDGIEAIYRGEELRFSWVVDIVDTHVPVHTIVPQGKGRTAVLSEVPMRLYFGRDDHPQDPYLATALPFPINEITYRGVFSVVFGSATYDKKNHRGHLPVPINEELPPISAVVSRGPLLRNGGANPAWIIEDILTNTVWGRGIDPAKIHRGSFDKAAAFLNEEDFGLCFVVSDQTPASEMLDEVCRHIDGAIQVDRQTGQVRLKLIREYGTQPPGFEPDPLPVNLNEDNIVGIDAYLRPSFGEMPTVQVVTFRRRGQGVGSTEGTGWWGEDTENSSAFAHDTSGAITRGKIDAPPIDYPGIPDSGLAVRVAQRDLRANATPRSTVELTVVGAVGQSIYAGDTIRVTYPKYGIAGVVFRVTNVDIGPLTNGLVRLQAIEDVFSFDRASIVPQLPPAPEPAVPASWQYSYEMPSWLRRTQLGLYELRNFENYDWDQEAQVVLAVENTASMLDYITRIEDESGDMYESLTNYPPVLTVDRAIPAPGWSGPANEDNNRFEVSWVNGYEFDPVLDPGSIWMIVSGGGANEEIVQIVGYNESSKEIVFNRGMLDTPPRNHPFAALGDIKMFKIADSDWVPLDGWVEGVSDQYENIEIKALTRTLMGVQLDPDDAPIFYLETEERAYRVLSPAFMRVYTTDLPGGSWETDIEWDHRDITAEPSSQLSGPDDYGLLKYWYRVRIFGENTLGNRVLFRNQVVISEDDPSDNGFTYTAAMEQADSGRTTRSPYLDIDITTMSSFGGDRESLNPLRYRHMR